MLFLSLLLGLVLLVAGGELLVKGAVKLAGYAAWVSGLGLHAAA
ncbi:MAG: hypothetical protein ACK4M6_05270 [Hyphomonas sp.]